MKSEPSPPIPEFLLRFSGGRNWIVLVGAVVLALWGALAIIVVTNIAGSFFSSFASSQYSYHLTYSSAGSPDELAPIIDLIKSRDPFAKVDVASASRDDTDIVLTATARLNMIAGMRLLGEMASISQQQGLGLQEYGVSQQPVGSWSTSLVQAGGLSSAALLSLFLVYARTRPKLRATFLSWKPRLPWWRAVALGALSGVGLYVVMTALGLLIGSDTDQPAVPETGELFGESHTWLILPVATLAAPLLEEYAFRAWMLNRMAAVTGPWPALIVSSILFALMHHYGFGQALLVLVVGLGLGGIWLRYRSLTACVTAHAVINLILILGASYQSS